MEQLGYGHPAQSVGPQTLGLSNHVAYFGGWGMSDEDVRQSNYFALDPDELLGIANMRRAEEVVQPRGRNAATQLIATFEGMRRARNLERFEEGE